MKEVSNLEKPIFLFAPKKVLLMVLYFVYTEPVKGLPVTGMFGFERICCSGFKAFRIAPGESTYDADERTREQCAFSFCLFFHFDIWRVRSYQLKDRIVKAQHLLPLVMFQRHPEETLCGQTSDSALIVELPELAEGAEWYWSFWGRRETCLQFISSYMSLWAYDGHVRNVAQCSLRIRRCNVKLRKARRKDSEREMIGKPPQPAINSGKFRCVSRCQRSFIFFSSQSHLITR